MAISTPLPRSLVLFAGVVLMLLGASAPTAQVLDAETGEVRLGLTGLEQLPADVVAPTQRGDDPLTLVGRLATGETRGMTLVGDLLYRSNGGYMEVLDISDDEAPVVLGRFLVDQAVVADVAVEGNLAFVAAQRPNVFGTRGSLEIVDVSDPANPIGVGAITGRSFFGVKVVGNLAFGAALGGGLRIYDVSDPAAPTELAGLTVGGSVLNVAIEGDLAFLAAGPGGFRVVDVSDPAAPVVIGSLPIADAFATDVVYADGLAFVSAQPLGLVVFDVSDPANPVQVGVYDVDEPGNQQMRSVQVANDIAFLGKDNGVIAFDISDPANITRLGTLNFNVPGSGQSIIVDNDRVLVGNRYHGVRVIDAANLAEMSQITLIENGGFSFKVTVHEGIAYVVDLIGQLRLVDISDPANPVELSRVRDLVQPYRVDVANGIAYVTQQGSSDVPDGGLTLIDVSDPTNPEVLQFVPTAASANGVLVHQGTIFVASGLTGTGEGNLETFDQETLGMLDLVDAGNTPLDVTVSGNHAFAATFGSGLSIFDVSNPVNLTQVSFGQVGAFSTSVEVDGSVAFVGNVAFDIPSGLLVADVSDPSDPQVLDVGATFAGGSPVDVAYGAGKAYTVVDMVGLYQFDVSDPSDVEETAYIVTSDRAVGVDFENGYVVVVDAGTGVWVFQDAGAVTTEEGPQGADPLLLGGTHPNPFTSQTTVRYRLPEAGHVRVSVHDLLGREVAVLVDGNQAQGWQETSLNARGLAAGIYLVRVSAGSEVAVSRVTLVR